MPRSAAPIDITPFLDLLEKRAPRPLSVPEMVRLLELDDFDVRAIRRRLDGEVERKVLRLIGKTRYQWLREVDRRPESATKAARQKSSNRFEGIYTRVRAGYGFVALIGRAAARFDRDVLVEHGEEGPALHGDRVLVEILGREVRKRRVRGRIVEVTDSAHHLFVGALEHGRNGWILLPDSELLPPIELLGEPLPKAGDRGQYALVRLTRRATATTAAGGVLERIVGAGDDPEVQFLGIVCAHGLRLDFPADVESAAAALPVDPTPEDYAGRDDLRALPLVTIDGETARDFDDAVHVQREGSGYRLWVAIADVSHYVTPGSSFDLEASIRGTSVYFPDRAIPMLPPRLSNELCSLNPGRDRLVLVAELGLDRAGAITGTRVYRAVMCSRARLTYTQVAAVLSQTHTPQIEAWRRELTELLPNLELMLELMQVLNRARRAAGSLDLDLPEALVDLSDEGRSIGVRLLQRNDAHRIIEELMLVANRAVAAHLRQYELPFPYRVHEPPSNEKIDELNEFLGPFGVHVTYRGEVRPADVQRLIGELEGHPLARVLTRQVLRALTQAHYSVDNAGHFGLAFPIYCHFTSPIRRYPDLLVHRQLGRLLDGDENMAREDAERLAAASLSSSQSERRAMEAERAMLDLKKAEFMLEHLLEPEPGTIVSITDFGFFVELDAYPVEGLVRLESLEDVYTFVESERSLRGARKRQRYRLGDRVEVEATEVSLRRRTVDFRLLRRIGPVGRIRPGARV